MRILITTGIYPPALGGPAQYAKNLATAFTELGHQVTVKTYQLENKLPTGLRHLYFFFKILSAVWRSDFVIALDTFSVGLPTVAAGRLWGKKVIIRTGGDFLWEGYVERTGDLVLLCNFYQTTIAKWSLKEKIIFKLTRWILHRATWLVFSTDWQRQIWLGPYQLDWDRSSVIENYYGPKEPSQDPRQKNFIFAGRPLKLKNLSQLTLAFERAKRQDQALVLERLNLPYAELMIKLSTAYAVIVPSISEVSPNLVLEALRYNRPVVMTKYSGLAEVLSDVVLMVDPLDTNDLERQILALANLSVYQSYRKKLSNFTKTHLWSDMAQEFLLLIPGLR